MMGSVTLAAAVTMVRDAIKNLCAENDLLNLFLLSLEMEKKIMSNKYFANLFNF